MFSIYERIKEASEKRRERSRKLRRNLLILSVCNIVLYALAGLFTVWVLVR